jgi:hypothetical protein
MKQAFAGAVALVALTLAGAGPGAAADTLT